MPRSRRRIKSNRCYEICFRARSTLPLTAHRIIKMFIQSALARTQRDDKVTICHHIWNGSHPHLLIVTKDSQQCVNFYSELQKKITDTLKRILGLDYLEIWEGYPMVAEILDLEKAKERIAYLYANPAQDNLESSIELFPGYSSWKDFNLCLNSLAAKTQIKCPWIRLPSIPAISSCELDQRADKGLVKLLTKKNKTTHLLVTKPNEWMSCFGVESDEEVKQINTEIIEMVRQREKDAQDKRAQEGKGVMGAAKLRSQPILKPHTPKKRERKVMILTSINKLRVDLIEEFKEFCAECKSCYHSWLQGDFNVKWPPGAFKPPLPPNMNIVSF